MSIEENIHTVNDRIRSACQRAGRSFHEVKLIAVTKTRDPETIMKAVKCGVNLLGENKVQELVEKYPMIKENVEWHMIGHLQTNKVKYLVDKVSMIHSVDNVKLAEEINKRFEKAGKVIDVLVEINIGGEESKHGIKPEDTIKFINEISNLKNIKICGLMTVAPAFEDKEKVRPYFKKMREIFEKVKESNIENIDMKYLSMGMTNDYTVAIEEGANIVRIGTGIFGPRNY